MVEKIKNYLLQDDRDYDEGLILLAKNSKNRILLQRLGRKAHPEKLEYELKKIVARYELIQTHKVKSPKKDKTSKKPKKEKVKSPKKDKTSKKPKKEKEVNQSSIGDDDETSTNLPVIEKPKRLRVVQGEQKINYADLPADLQAKWDENADSYKIARSLHEKLKLMEKASPEDRKPLVDQLIELSDKVRANWNVIDAYDPSQEPPVEDDKKPAYIDHKRIQANRTYISKNLKKLKTTPDDQELRKRIQVRITELIQIGETFKDEKLKELGFEL